VNTVVLVFNDFIYICYVRERDIYKEEMRISVLQQNRLQWFGNVLRKGDDDWVKKYMEYEAEGPRPRGRPKETWKEDVKKDRQARKLNKEDAINYSRWRKLIKDVTHILKNRMCVNVSSGTGPPW